MELLRHRLQARNIDNHGIADLLPSQHHHQAPKAKGGAIAEILAKKRDQHAVVNDHLPDIAQNNTADQIRHKKHCSKEIGAADTAGQRQRHRKRDHIDQQNRNHRKGGGEQKGIPKLAIGCENTDIVIKPDKGGVFNGGILTKGEVKPHEKGDHEPNDKRHQGRQ